MFQDSAGIPQVINDLVMQPLRAVLVAAINLGWLAVFDYAMALVALVLIPAEFALAWAFSAPLRRAFLDAREASALAITRIEETLASIKAVKAYGREDHEAAVYANDNWTALLMERKARMRLLVYHVASNFIRSVAYVAVVYIGACQVVGRHGGGFAATALSLGLFQGTLMAFGRMGADAHRLAMLW